MALANGKPGYTPPVSIQKMMEQTSLLPTRWAEIGDGVLVVERVWVVEQKTDKTEDWSQALGNVLVDAIKGKGYWTRLHDVLPLITEVRPWGWSPAICHRLRTVGIPECLLPSTDELAAIRELSSRERAVEVLAKVQPKLQFLKGESAYCRTEQEVAECLNRWTPAILKAPWSSSGKGLRFSQNGCEDTLQPWYSKIIRQQGGVVVEPFYDKLMDFAMEFWSDGSSVIYQGLSLFDTHPNGAYKGNRLWTEEKKWEALQLYLSVERGKEMINLLEDNLRQMIDGRYHGPLGVDMMILKDGSVHPCVEINLRMTMGYVSLL